MFFGQFETKLDLMKRFAVPEEYKKLLEEEGSLKQSFYIIGSDALSIYSAKAFSDLTQERYNQKTSKMQVDVKTALMANVMMSTYMELKYDKKGRIKLPKLFVKLLKFKIKEPIYIVGCGDHFEIWKKDIWEKEEEIQKWRDLYLQEFTMHMYRVKKSNRYK